MIIEGVFHKYILIDEKTGYTVLRIKISDGTYVIGTSNRCLVPPNLTEGCMLRLEGEMGQSREAYFPYYAEPGFSFTKIEVILPPDIAHTTEYISGMKIKGLGDTFAERVANITGPDLKKYFTDNPDPEKLVKKIKHPFFRLETAEQLIKHVFATETIKEMYDYLRPAGMTYQQVFRLYNAVAQIHNDMTIDELKQYLSPTPLDEKEQKNLYDYCEEASIPFTEADAVGKELGYSAYNATRRRFLIKSVIAALSAKGHTWSDIKTIYETVKYTEAQSAFPDIIISKNALYATICGNPNDYVVEDKGERIYTVSRWKNEHSIAYHIKRLKTSHRPLPFRSEYVDSIENECGIKFSETQRRCFGMLKTTGVKIVTGNAGTGKTTVISNLLHVYTEMCPEKSVALCAPTGRAAQRMTELCEDFGTSVKASTIHKLLNFRPFPGQDTEFNEQHPLPADFVIVDEMSMVDTDLFAMLLAAIKPGALVILCGDVDQLPSVAAGKVFEDLINSGAVDFIRLDTNYRQGEGNLLIENADKINNGENDIKTDPTFHVITCGTEADMQVKAIEIAQIEHGCTMLSTVHRGFAGVDTMNQILQPILNAGSKPNITFGGSTYKVGDLVLMHRNNYEIGYVNGDIGTIETVSKEGLTIKFGTEIKLIPKDSFKDISLAYCMTIHKSQGSEYDTVVILLPTTSKGMLERNLLYTAVTRAKKKVYIIEQQGAIKTAIYNRHSSERRTTLTELLQEV